MEKSRTRGIGTITIACTCGAQTVVDAARAGQVRACPSCHAPLKAPPAKKPAGNGVREEELRCACGERLFVKPEHVGKVAQCPSCRREMRVEKSRDPQTLVTRIRLVDAKPAPPAEVELTCACGAAVFVRPEWAGKHAQCPKCRLEMRVVKMRDPATQSTRLILVGPKAKKGGETGRKAPAPAPKPANQELLCPCGAQLKVGPEHAGKQAQCAACGRLMVIESVADTSAGMPSIRARVVGQVDLDSWSLDDFK